MREIVMGLAATATVGGGGLWYAGVFEGGEVYPLAPAEVARRLARMDMPPDFAAALDGNDMARLRVSKQGDEEVRWDVLVNGVPTAKFTAAISPEGDGTRVEVHFALHDTDYGRTLAEHTPLSTPLTREMAEVALGEQVDAVLEQRPYDDVQVANHAALYVATHPAEAYAYGRKMERLISNADPELLDKARDAIEANPPTPDREPAHYGEGASTEHHDWRAESDRYEASQPMDDTSPAGDLD